MKRVLAVGLGAAVLFVGAHPPMWSGPHPLFPSWDLTRVFAADLAFLGHSLRGGQLPLWNPFDRTGYAFAAEPQSGVFDVTTWGVVGLAMLLGLGPMAAVVLKCVVHFAILGSGFAAWARQRSLPGWIQAFLVVVLVLCPRFDKLKDQSALWPLAWTGWLLFCIDRTIDRPTPARGIALGVTAALVVDAGYPPSAFRIALLAIPYAVVVALERVYRVDATRVDFRAFTIALFAAFIVFVPLVAGTIVSTLQVLPITTRADLNAAHVLRSGTQPHDLWSFVAPHAGQGITHRMSYLGFATVFGVVAILARPRVVSSLLLLIALVAFGLACGDDAALLPAVSDLPGFRNFRIPGHYLAIAVIAAAMAGAVGLASLERSRPGWIRLAVVVTVPPVAWWVAPIESPPRSILALAASIVLVIAVARAPARYRDVAGWGLVCVCAADLFIAARPVAALLRRLPDDARAEQLAARIAQPHAYRIADFGWEGHRPGPRMGIRDLVGHRPALTDPLYLAVYREAPRSANVLRAMNVGFATFSTRVRAMASPQLVRDREIPRGFRVLDPWPRVFFVAEVDRVADAAAALAWLRRHHDPAAVVLDPAAGRSATTRGARAFILPDRSVFGDADAEVEITAPEPGMLVINEAFAPGWVATVDAEAVEIVRVNLIARGIQVPAGSHHVRLEYRPRGLRTLFWIWFATWCGLALVVAVRWLMMRNEP